MKELITVLDNPAVIVLFIMYCIPLGYGIYSFLALHKVIDLLRKAQIERTETIYKVEKENNELLLEIKLMLIKLTKDKEI